MSHQPSLWVILVWDNPESLRYIGQKRKWAETLGISFELFLLDKQTSENAVLEQINQLNNNSDIDGFMVQTPLPKHIDTQKILNAIDPKKDVDGFHPENQWKIMIGDHSGLVPCTPAGVMYIFKSENISLAGKIVTIIGRSNIVWKPLVNLCINAGATVIACNSHTQNLSEHTKKSDIIILATGVPGLLSIEMVSDQAVIIDVWFSVIDGKIYGDACYQELLNNGNTITPVPGWVGPLTVAMLMKNTLQSAQQKKSMK